MFISPFVVNEIIRGDAEAARLRQEVLRGIPELPATPNAEKEPHIREVCVRHGWRCPEICTPEQLLPREKGDTP